MGFTTTRAEIESFLLAIPNEEVSSIKKKAILKRLAGLALDNNSVLDQDKVKLIFEGMLDLQAYFIDSQKKRVRTSKNEK